MNEQDILKEVLVSNEQILEICKRMGKELTEEYKGLGREERGGEEKGDGARRERQVKREEREEEEEER